jgi:mannose-6-phosphate isomerase-like protein (cupin superfamily)
MKGFTTSIETESLTNEDFRRVLYTTHNCQLVLMSLKPNEEIGEEVHGVDQFLRCEQGEGVSVLDGVEHPFTDGFAVIVPAGTKHNIMNRSSTQDLKLYTLYAPPHHIKDKVHKTKADSEADENNDHFDGQTS